MTFFPTYFTTFLPGPAIIRAGPNIAIGTIPPFCFMTLSFFVKFQRVFAPISAPLCVRIPIPVGYLPLLCLNGFEGLFTGSSSILNEDNDLLTNSFYTLFVSENVSPSFGSFSFSLHTFHPTTLLLLFF